MPNNKNEFEDELDIGRALSRYAQIIEAVFKRYWKSGKTEFVFERDELEQVCSELGIAKPKNLGDVVYTFRYRKPLPPSILATQPADRGWLILGDGDARYRFRLNKLTHIRPTNGLLVRKIPDSTPEIIARYALSDEQALLAKVRYNRLIDIFLSITACSLQNLRIPPETDHQFRRKPDTDSRPNWTRIPVNLGTRSTAIRPVGKR